MINSVGKLLCLVWLACLLAVAGTAFAASQDGDEKVVYHINDSAVAKMALGNVKNHLAATQNQTKIVVVAHGFGVDFLLEGAQDKNGNPYNIQIEELLALGVDFRVCNNTLKSRKIDPKTVIQGARIVPSGVAELGKLQAREGYAYIKP